MKSPFWVLGKALYFAWWPFGYLISLLVVVLTPWILHSEKRWSWLIARYKAMGAEPASIESLQSARRTYLSGGATVILPESPTVEQAQPESTEASGEAKPS